MVICDAEALTARKLVHIDDDRALHNVILNCLHRGNPSLDVQILTADTMRKSDRHPVMAEAKTVHSHIIQKILRGQVPLSTVVLLAPSRKLSVRASTASIAIASRIG